jgi:hypothetical protein
VNLKRQPLIDDLNIVNLWLTAGWPPSDPGDGRMVVRQKDGPKSIQCPPEGGRGQGYEQTRIRVGPKRIRVWVRYLPEVVRVRFRRNGRCPRRGDALGQVKQLTSTQRHGVGLVIRQAPRAVRHGGVPLRGTRTGETA